MKQPIRITNVSNPAALGVEAETEWSIWQFIVLRGAEDGVLFSSKTASGAWTPPCKIVNPDRFGPQPTTWPELRRWVDNFFTNDKEESA